MRPNVRHIVSQTDFHYRARTICSHSRFNTNILSTIVVAKHQL